MCYRVKQTIHNHVLGCFLASQLIELKILTNRSRTEIVVQILEAANGNEESDGITRTKIMYKVSLENVQLNEYLALLIENGLLHYDSAMSKFKTTEKGLTFLQGYNQIDQILKDQQI